jgi:hypothetical protein
MKTTFLALDVPVLNFSRKPDRQDMIIPPECYAVFNQRVPVVFDKGDMSGNPPIIGYATLRREANCILACMEIESAMPSGQKALRLISKLFPCTIFKILDAHEMTVTHIKIEHLLLTPNGNADRRILPLGDKVNFKAAKDMN